MKRPAIAVGADPAFTMPVHLHDALAQAIGARPDGLFLLIDEHGGETPASYASMWEKALATLGGLKEMGCKPGDVILLDAGDVLHFISALWAVMLGGMTAVPIARSRWNANAANEFEGKCVRLASRLANPLILSNTPKLFSFSPSPVVEYRALQSCAKVATIEGRDPQTPAVLIPTSGTTGRSELVALDSRAVMHRWWPGDPSVHTSTRFIGWTPMDHIMGLGMAAPNYQTKIYLPPELFVRNSLRWLELVEKHRITHSVMTNFGMQLLVDALPGKRGDISSLKRIGVGAEMISPKLCAAFVEHLTALGMPADAVILGYGLSECGPVAGGLRSFQSPGADHHAPLLIDRPTAGHAVRIASDEGLCEEGTIGRIEVRGSTMTSGYYGNPQANARLFTEDGWLRTGDMGYLSDGCLCVTGREKETISINARKFSCNEIDAALAAVAGVEFAHVFAASDHHHVSLVYGVIGQGDPAVEKALRRTCAEKFGFGLAQCIPLTARELPRTHSGKLQRHRLQELAVRKTPAIAMPPQEAATTELKICAIMSRFLGGVYPQPTDNFFELGGDSLGALTFTVAVESQMDVSLPPAVFTRAPTCRDVARYIERGDGLSDKVALVPVRQGEGRGGLFLAPGVWGNNAYASALAADMEAGIAVWTFHLKHPENRDAHAKTLAEFAQECCVLIRAAQPQGPYHLAGYSFGGLLAYEMARHLLAEGFQVATLSIIDTTARLEERNPGVTAQVQDNKRIYEYYRDMIKSYVPRPLDCRVDYYRAKDNPFLPRSEPSGGWQYLAGRGVQVFDIAGDHHSIVRGQSRASIAAYIDKNIRAIACGTFIPPLALSADTRQAIEEARQASCRGEMDAEIRLLSQVVTAAAELPFWVYGNYAEALFDAERIEEAVQSYHLALAHDPWPLTTYKRFAPAIAKYALDTLASEALAAIASMVIDDSASAYAKASVCSVLGDISGAIANLRVGLALIEDNLDLRYMLADLLAQMDRADEAQKEIMVTLLQPVENDVVFLRLGKLAWKIKDYGLAERCFQKSLAVNPHAFDALHLLGIILKARGNTEAAAELRKRGDIEERRMTFNDA